MAKTKRKWKWPVGWALVIAAALMWRQFGPGIPTETLLGGGGLAQAYANNRSGVMVEFDGQVQRELPDDKEGTPHQRFIVEVPNGHTVIVSHNLELAERVPVVAWEPIKVRGEYEWNAQGGVVHWTHRDPGAGIKHGWIEFKGLRYE